jgi:lactate permease
MHWTQVYDPLGNWWLSTFAAALPMIVLLGLLAGLKVKPHWCAIAGALTATAVAILIFKMPVQLAAMSFGYGVAFGILKIAWIVLAAVFLYDISVETGQFEIMKESIARITPDRRLQVLLVAFSFGAFIEGAAGFGAPVAIAGAFMIGLGFRPFQAAALNLIANTAPVAWGAHWYPHPHSGRGFGSAGIRSECDDRAHTSLRRDPRSLLAGKNNGELAGNL